MNPSIICSQLYIRADGNEEIASGHLMRCLTIARAYRALTETDRPQYPLPVFLVSDPGSEAMLRARFQYEDEFPVTVLHSDYTDPESELTALCDMLSSGENTCLLVDSYYITPAYFDRLRRCTYLAYIDDLAAFDYPVDLLINYDPDPDTSLFESAGDVIAGLSYAPIRADFANHESCPPISDRIEHILVLSGGIGYGSSEALYALTKSLSDLTNAKIHVVTGQNRDLIERLSAQAACDPSFSVDMHEYLPNLPAFLKTTDLVVSAAGTTLYEVCAMGIPAISFTVADNQMTAAMGFEDIGLIPHFGDLRVNNTTERITRSLMPLLKKLRSRSAREEMRATMRNAVDGKGADRIALALKKLMTA